MNQFARKFAAFADNVFSSRSKSE